MPLELSTTTDEGGGIGFGVYQGVTLNEIASVSSITGALNEPS